MQINALMKNLIATEVHGLGLRFSMCQGEQRPFLVYRVFPKSMTVPSALRLYHGRPSSQGIPKTSQFFISSDKILICVPVLSSIISPLLQNAGSLFFFPLPLKKAQSLQKQEFSAPNCSVDEETNWKASTKHSYSKQQHSFGASRDAHAGPLRHSEVSVQLKAGGCGSDTQFILRRRAVLSVTCLFPNSAELPQRHLVLANFEMMGRLFIKHHNNTASPQKAFPQTVVLWCMFITPQCFLYDTFSGKMFLFSSPDKFVIPATWSQHLSSFQNCIQQHA